MSNIQKSTNKPAIGSITDLARRRNMLPEAIMAEADIVILFDHSGSMGAFLPNGERVWHAAVRALEGVQAANDGRVVLVAFDSIPTLCLSGRPPEPAGGTALGGALRKVKPLDIEGTKFILISDGQPTDGIEQNIALARTFTCPIDCIFIGSDNDRAGIAFMNRLSEATGGRHSKGAVDPLLLESHIKG